VKAELAGVEPESGRHEGDKRAKLVEKRMDDEPVSDDWAWAGESVRDREGR